MPPKYSPSIDRLPAQLQNLFKKMFVDGHSNSDLRPSSVLWIQALRQYYQSLCMSNHSVLKPKLTKPKPRKYQPVNRASVMRYPGNKLYQFKVDNMRTIIILAIIIGLSLMLFDQFEENNVLKRNNSLVHSGSQTEHMVNTTVPEELLLSAGTY